MAVLPTVILTSARRRRNPAGVPRPDSSRVSPPRLPGGKQSRASPHRAGTQFVVRGSPCSLRGIVGRWGWPAAWTSGLWILQLSVIKINAG